MRLRYNWFDPGSSVHFGPGYGGALAAFLVGLLPFRCGRLRWSTPSDGPDQAFRVLVWMVAFRRAMYGKGS